MAEFAASLVGLISTAEVVLTRIYKYIKHVKHAEEEVLALSDDVGGLYGILKRVSLVIDGFNGVGSGPITDSRQISSCVASLDRLRDKLAQFHEHDGANSGSLRKRCKWPFDRSETLELKRGIETYKTTLNIALSADTISTTLETLSEAQSISNKMDRVQALLEAQARITLDKQKEEILRTVGPHSPLRQHQTNVSLRHSGTGAWFIESTEFQRWLHTRNRKLWVYGIPGAGKSILAAAAVSEALQLSDENNAVAYFYCDYKKAATQDPMLILGSLAEQIARQSARSFEQLAEFAKRHCSTERLQSFSCSHRNLCELIMEMSVNFRNVIIAVDGLDECGDHIRTVMEHLTGLGASSSSIKVLLSSRDIVDIRDFLEDYEQVSIAASNVDLRLYVGAEVEARVQKKSRKRLYINDPDLKGEIMDKLIDGAKGMFRWVAVQLDYICDMGSDDDIRSALDSLPPDLFSSYKRLLLDINKKPLQSQLLAQRALKWIMWQGSIGTKSLVEALSVKPGMTRISNVAMIHENRMLQLCGSLIRSTTADDCTYLESAHFTVKEFLSSLEDSQGEKIASYSLDSASDYRMFAIVAGNYLCCKEFAKPDSLCYYSESDDLGMGPQPYAQYSFRKVANENLLRWARDCLNDPEVFDPIKRLFRPSNDQARIFALQDREQYVQGFGASREILNQLRFITPLHEAAIYALPELCEYLLQHEGECNSQSPLGTPLHCALIGSHQLLPILRGGPLARRVESLEMIVSVEATVQILVSHGADLTKSACVEADGLAYSVTLLALRCFGERSLNLVRLLVDAKAVLCGQSLEELQSILESFDNLQVYSLIQAIEPANVGPGLTTQLSRLKTTAFQKFEKDCDALPDDIYDAASIDDSLFEKAIEYNKLRMLISLLDNGTMKIDWQNDDGENAAHLAAKADRVEVLEFLINRGVEYDRTSLRGRTPLHYAVKFRSPDSFRLLLSRGVNSDAIDNDGYSSLHFAAKYNNLLALQLFQDASLMTSVMLDRSNKDGVTALMLAAQNGNVEIVEVLLKAGADSAVEDNGAYAAIYFAVGYGHLEVLNTLSRDWNCWEGRCQTVTDDGDVFNDMLLTHVAAVFGHQQCLEFLLTFTSHFGIEDKACTYSLLWFAVYSGDPTTVQYLLDRGAKLTPPASRWTLLHVAVDKANNDAVDMLLRHGHDFHVISQQWETPMMVARRRGHHKLLATLKEHEQSGEKPTLFEFSHIGF